MKIKFIIFGYVSIQLLSLIVDKGRYYWNTVNINIYIPEGCFTNDLY